LKTKEEMEIEAKADADSKARASRKASAASEERPGLLEGLVERLLELSPVDIPDEVIDMAGRFVRIAEEVFVGEGKAKQKQRFAVKLLRAWLAEHDIKQIPDWVETPLENAFATLAVQMAFRANPGLRGGSAKRAAERAAQAKAT
jgi:hypothetical protein